LPHRGWLFDLDGTVYRGQSLVPGADAAIAALRAARRRVAFLSNTPIQTRDAYARQLTRLGIGTPVAVGIDSSLVLARHPAHLGMTASECAIVGDRLETDIVMGKRLGLATVLVLTGITPAGDPRIAEIAPDLILSSLRDLVR